jgi:putative endonuclease
LRHHSATALTEISCKQLQETEMREYGGYTYMLASKRNGTLYTGVTSKLVDRVWRHKQGLASAFTRTYGVTLLVWFEGHNTIESAIQRETSIKRWHRKWKLDLIEQNNPDWRDLYEDLTRMPTLPASAKPLDKP